MDWGTWSRVRSRENLQLGNSVVADSVNPWRLTRDWWRAAAKDVNAPYFDVEVVCSDISEHRRRVENRSSDITGLALPTWQEVVDREYHPWTELRLQIDTAVLTIQDAADKILQWVSQ